MSLATAVSTESMTSRVLRSPTACESCFSKFLSRDLIDPTGKMSQYRLGYNWQTMSCVWSLKPRTYKGRDTYAVHSEQVLKKVKQRGWPGVDGGVCEKAWIKSALPLFSSYFLHLSLFLFRTTWNKKGALVGNLGEPLPTLTSTHCLDRGPFTRNTYLCHWVIWSVCQSGCCSGLVGSWF